MSINGITDLELKMFAKGYASSRLICAKTNMHRSTVCRLIRLNTLDGTKVGKTSFATVASVVAFLGDNAVLFDLEDWSDVMPAEAEIS